MFYPPAIPRALKLSGLIVAAWLGLVMGSGAQDKAAGESFSDPAAIQQRLEAARAELDALPEDDLTGARELFQKLGAACQYHLAAVESLAAAEVARDTARKERLAWDGFPGTPPYPIVMLDEVRELQAVLESSKLGIQAQIRNMLTDIDHARDRLKAQQQAARRHSEAAENAKSPEQRRMEERNKNLALISARIQAEEVERLDLRLKAQRLELETTDTKLELAKIQRQALIGRTGFSKAEFDEINQRISKQREETIQAMVKAAGNSKEQDPLHNWQAAFLDLEGDFWEQRFAAHNSKDPAVARSTLAELRAMQKRIDDWVEIAQLRLAGLDGSGEEIDPGRLRDAMLRLRKQQRLIAFTIEDLEARDAKLPRGTPALDYIGRTLQAFWNAELYLVEETEIVDGKKIPTYRAITVGKLLRLTFILIFGWLLLCFLSRRIKAAVLRKANVPKAAADLTGKWAFGIGLALLVCYAFNAVSIPLTVFAFLGGALAIGVGFGTQTILKNLISGIIILFERPLKVGDVVEVANITGTICEIGMRASVIRHFDGIETLVPNSILLENQLTNWTFSSTIIRHSIVVGVAYGSPTREVARLLLAVAAEHGLVKEDPEPEVRFDDFGSDSLIFTLLFWLDTRTTGRSQLASDLRFMIDKTFAEAGIVIAFPQRDLHFDSARPLRVEFSRAAQNHPPG